MPNYSAATRAKRAASTGTIAGDISTLPWETLVTLGDIDTSTERTTLLSPFKYPWVLPALMSWLSYPGVVRFMNRDSELCTLGSNKISTLATLKDLGARVKAGNVTFNNKYTVSPSQVAGIFAFLTKTPRGEIMPTRVTQSSPEGVRWAANVPLFYSAFKESDRKTLYSRWDWEDSGVTHALDARCAELTNYTEWDFSEFTDETKLEILTLCKPIRSGLKAGELKTLSVITSPTFPKELAPNDLFKEFLSLPVLVRGALLQTWVFQPKLQHYLGIYDLNDLDNAPEPKPQSPSINVFEKVIKPTVDSIWA